MALIEDNLRKIETHPTHRSALNAFSVAKIAAYLFHFH